MPVPVKRFSGSGVLLFSYSLFTRTHTADKERVFYYLHSPEPASAMRLKYSSMPSATLRAISSWFSVSVM